MNIKEKREMKKNKMREMEKSYAKYFLTKEGCSIEYTIETLKEVFKISHSQALDAVLSAKG